MKKMSIIVLSLLLASVMCGCGEDSSENSVPDTSEEKSSSVLPALTDDDEVSLPQLPSQTVSQKPVTQKKAVADKTVVYDAYRSVVDELVNSHGIARIISDRSENRGYIGGVSVIRLLDLNKDGVEELLCTYGSDNKTIADTQEIFTFSEGSAVSIYKDAINYEDDDVNKPYAEYSTSSDAIYVITNGKDAMSYDGTDMIVVSDVRPGGQGSKRMNIYESDQSKTIINDTLKVMKKIGCNSSQSGNNTDIKSTEGYKTASSIYKKYLASREWATYEYEGKKLTDKGLVVDNSVVFDYNGDGVFEMYLDTTYNYDLEIPEPYYSHEPSYLLTIEDGKVKPLLSALYISGDEGGSRVRLMYSDADDSVYLASSEALYKYDNGISANTTNIELYKMSGTNLTEEPETIFSEVKTNDEGIKTAAVYKLNGEKVKEADYDKKYDSLHSIAASCIDKFYNEKSDLSNSERLYELGAIE